MLFVPLISPGVNHFRAFKKWFLEVIVKFGVVMGRLIDFAFDIRRVSSFSAIGVLPPTVHALDLKFI